MLKIGEVAKRAGVKVDTIRFYERRGVLPAPSRRESGYRMFPPETVGRIRLAKDAQKMGLSLDEVIALLRLCDSRDAACGELRELGKRTLQRLDGKIAALVAMRQGLVQLLSSCQSSPQAACKPVRAIDTALHASESFGIDS